MQAELQSESEATAEGEDSIVEAAAVTGVRIRQFHQSHGTSNYKRQRYRTVEFLYVLCTGVVLIPSRQVVHCVQAIM